jgi:predicted component of type VI protein secretion system
MILADDRSHAVVALDRDLVVSRNAELLAVLISYKEPTEETWKALEQHMEAENTTAEIAREVKSKASIERKRKAAEAR